MNDGTYLFAQNDTDDVFGVFKCKENNGNFVVHRKRGCGGVHNGEMLRKNLVIGDGVVFYGCGVFFGVGGLNAIYFLGKTF